LLVGALSAQAANLCRAVTGLVAAAGRIAMRSVRSADLIRT